MTDFKEFLFTEDFKAYRKRQIQVIATHIHNMLQGYTFQDNGAELKGAMELTQKIIGLPSTLLHDKELERNLNLLIKEDIAGITNYLVRRYLEPE